MKIWQKTFKFKLRKLDTAKAWVKVIVKVVQCQYEWCVHKAASKNKQTLQGTKLCTAVVSQTNNRRHPNWSFENWTHWKHMRRVNYKRSRISICVHIWLGFWNTNLYEYTDLSDEITVFNSAKVHSYQEIILVHHCIHWWTLSHCQRT